MRVCVPFCMCVGVVQAELFFDMRVTLPFHQFRMMVFESCEDVSEW